MPLWSRFKVSLCAVALPWIVFLVNARLSPVDLRLYGIVPRDPDRLWAILTSPFLHANGAHLIGNSLPLLLFSWLALRRGTARYLAASAVIILVSGLLVWLFGRTALHIGASGWVFGLWGLIVADGWYERSPVAVLTSLVVILLYGGMIWGVLPRPMVSYEYHLGGLIAGVTFSALSQRRRRPR